MKRTKLDDRILPTYSKGEEIFNMVSHIVGGALGVIALILCLILKELGYSPIILTDIYCQNFFEKYDIKVIYMNIKMEKS